MNLLHQIRALFEPVLAELAPDKAKVPDYLNTIKPCQDTDLADYQANFAMALAKVWKVPARIAAERVVGKLPTDVITDPIIASPREHLAFINIRFRDEFLAKAVQQIAADPKLGVEPPAKAKTFVIDYSSPNVAKPLHVGHLRSTIIGDALTRILRFLGHTVVTDNHLGDWGTQFGMLLYGYKHFRDEAALKADPVREMVRLYVHVRNLISEGDDDAAEEGANPVA